MNLDKFTYKSMKEEGSILEQILEEAANNPILTKVELKDLLYFPTEEEIEREEKITEYICNRIDEYCFQNGVFPPKEILQKIEEDANKRGYEL